MLVLSRQIEEEIIISLSSNNGILDNTISIKIVDVRGDKVRLGITADRNIIIHRKEVFDDINRERESQQNEKQ